MFWVEQLAHLALGLAPSALVAALMARYTPMPVVIVCFLAACVGIVPGIAREFVQNWGDDVRKGSLEDSLMDLTFWTAGGLLGMLAALQ